MTLRMFEYETGEEVPITFSTFPGGEEHVRIEQPLSGRNYIIQSRLTSSVWVMRLLLLDAAINHNYPDALYTLQLPYLPYARQDRVCNEGEANGVEVFCYNILDQLKSCDNIRVVDVHSPAGARAVVLEGITSFYHQADVLLQWEAFYSFANLNQCVLVAPDAGALHKTEEVADTLCLDMIAAKKVRDPLTTKIVSTTIDAEIDPDCHYLIVDDICDGGRTFIELANVLKEKGANHLHLYVTHGIFSAGFAELSKYFDTIWTTNSFTDRRPMVYHNTEIFTFDIFSIM